MSSPTIPKSSSRHQVLSILLPREQWPPLQCLRTLLIPDLRSGPHFNLADPFVPPEHFPAASQALRLHLSKLSPFKTLIKRERIGRAVFPKSATLFVELEFDPPNAFEELLMAVERALPQCNDLRCRAPGGRYAPHITLGRFEGEEELERALEGLVLKDWLDQEVFVGEVYCLNRIQGDPFEIKQIIPIGTYSGLPQMGPNSLLAKPHSRHCKTVMLAGIPSKMTTKELRSLLKNCRPINMEVVLNPNGNGRPLAVLEFASQKDAKRYVEDPWKPEGLPKMVARFIYDVTFPDLVGGCCSVNALKFEMQNKQRIAKITPVYDHRLQNKYNPLTTEPNQDALNDHPIDLHSNEIILASPNLNSFSLLDPEAATQELTNFTHPSESSKRTNWADQVEAEKAPLSHPNGRGKGKGNKKGNAKESFKDEARDPSMDNEDLTQISLKDESHKRKVLNSFVKRTVPLSPTEIENLLKAQSGDGFWQLQTVENYLQFSTAKCQRFLDGCGVRIFGEQIRHQAFDLFATMLLLSYLRFHFQALPFSFLGIETALPQHKERFLKAHEWVKGAERTLPFLSDRLGLGVNWDVTFKDTWAKIPSR